MAYSKEIQYFARLQKNNAPLLLSINPLFSVRQLIHLKLQHYVLILVLFGFDCVSAFSFLSSEKLVTSYLVMKPIQSNLQEKLQEAILKLVTFCPR